MPDFSLCRDFSRYDIDDRDENNWTPLMGAVRQGSLDAVRSLLARGADVNAIGGPGCRDEVSPLRIAVMDDNLPMADLLVKSGAKVNACDCYGNTALVEAALQCSAPMLQLLIDAGATMERCSSTNAAEIFDSVQDAARDLNVDPAPARKVLATHWLLSSAHCGDFNGVNEGLAQGADINERDENGRTVLFYAVEYLAPIDIGPFIRDSGADASVRDRHGQTPLHYLISISYCDDNTIPHIIPILLKAGIDVNARDMYGRTPIISASTAAICRVLAEAGADLNARAQDGSTPLIEAANGEVARFLVEHGADPCAMDEDRNTPLSQAVSTFPDDTSAVQALIRAGADVNARLWNGLTALHLARTPEMVRCLIAAGADPTARDIEGRLPSEACAEWMQPEEIEAAFGKFLGFANISTGMLQ
jgi:serine/threonine-protein phosphatase 6 regulatory ankyrin repeat subunit B